MISKHECKIKIKTDVESETFEVKGKDSTTTIYPNLKGEMFQFSIESDGSDAHVACPEISIGISQ